MFEDFLQRAYDFVAISLFFPFILIFVLAGLISIFVVGFVLLIPGIKSKWSELDKKGRIIKIVKIAIGAILLTIALFTTVFVITGFVEVVKQGGVFHYPHSTNE